MKPYLSVLVPVYNEAENLEPLASELTRALESFGKPWEAVFVDDGSKDSSFPILKNLAQAEPRFKVVRLGRNFGQTAALAAAFKASTGDIIATLDADQQNDPADIPRLVARLEDGFDLVSGWRKYRQDPWLTRILPSQLANALISRVTGTYLHDYGCTLKAYRRAPLENIRMIGEMHRFLPAFAGFQGARITEEAVNHRPRTRGYSKYGLMRTFKVLLDLMTIKFMEDYIAKPIYIFGGTGLAMGGASVLMAAYVLFHKFHDGVFVKDQPLFQVSIFFALVGFQLLLLGLLAEILIRIYYDIKDKPPYYVKETIGLP